MYPPKLSAGSPRRHHAVIYIHVKLDPPYTAEHTTTLLKPDPREVMAFTWLNRQTIQVLSVSLSMLFYFIFPKTFYETLQYSTTVQVSHSLDPREVEFLTFYILSLCCIYIVIICILFFFPFPKTQYVCNKFLRILFVFSVLGGGSIRRRDRE